MQKKDKQKILDEVWTTDRVSNFLSLTIPEGENEDSYLLYILPIKICVYKTLGHL